MKGEANAWVSDCETCAKLKQSHELKSPLRVFKEAHDPFQACITDYMGSYSMSKCRNNSVEHSVVNE
jgi:hypothetical protein